MGISLFSPAKINLYLAVTGRRPDGYHDLVSLVAPVDFGDTLETGLREPGAGGRFTLECTDPAVPRDGTNLVLKAAHAFAAASGWKGGAHFKLAKRIPLGAGLGGGSSNAVAALRALNQLSGVTLPETKLANLAASLGSDCALFLAGCPTILRGRGEQVEVLDGEKAQRLRGCRVLLFKPGFAVSTPWAYGRMAAEAPRHYLAAADAEERLDRWYRGPASATALFFNGMEGVVFEKYVALPVLREKLARDFGVQARMSGSGSACFILWDQGASGASHASDEIIAQITRTIHECWGPEAFVQETRVTGPMRRETGTDLKIGPRLV